MSVTFKVDFARVASPAVGSSYSSGLNGDSQAAKSPKRSFSSFFAALRYLFRKSVSSAPADAISASVPPSSEALQFSQFDKSAASGCVLCTVDLLHLDRVRRLVGILPIGLHVNIPLIGRALGLRLSTVRRDLNLLRHDIGLPIKRTKRGFVLTKPISLCGSCARIGENVRQTEGFRKYYKTVRAIHCEQ